jgi:hypothetical protein
LGSGKQNGEGVTDEPLNNARPLTNDKKLRMSSQSLEPPEPPFILREEELPASSAFDILYTNSKSPPRSMDLASNVREITPDNRRRIKSLQPGQENKAAAIIDITIVASATESERISDKKRKKRELEEQLRHSQELEELRTASGGMGRQMRSDSIEDESEEEI